MDFFGTKASVSKFFFLAGLSLASFSLFLHPADPVEFLKKAFFAPYDTFQIIYGYIQTMAFWISAALMTAGILGMLAVLVQRRRARDFFSRLNGQERDGGDSEENWMFL